MHDPGFCAGPRCLRRVHVLCLPQFEAIVQVWCKTCLLSVLWVNYETAHDKSSKISRLKLPNIKGLSSKSLKSQPIYQWKRFKGFDCNLPVSTSGLSFCTFVTDLFSLQNYLQFKFYTSLLFVVHLCHSFTNPKW